MTGNAKLLPPNATEFEKHLTDGITHPVNPVVVRGFKFDAPEHFLPWLIWEYGLEEIVPWLKGDLRRAIAEGVPWLRIRGTSESLRVALSWADLKVKRIEEEPPGEHFAEFQIGLLDVPNDLFVDSVVALAELSAPARSRLMRIYNDLYDVRRFILDRSHWGDLLSDYSGVQIYKDDPVLSFGRVNRYEAKTANVTLIQSTHRELVSLILSSGLYRLDYAILGNTPPASQNVWHSQYSDHHYRNEHPVTANGIELEHINYFAKAQIVLSESSLLDDINACFPVYTRKEIGQAPVLDEFVLSDETWRFELKPITERFAREKNYEAQSNFELPTIHSDHAVGRAYVIDGLPRELPITAIETIRPLGAAYPGVTKWHGHYHQNRLWTDTNPVVSSSHVTEGL